MKSKANQRSLRTACAAGEPHRSVKKMITFGKIIGIVCVAMLTSSCACEDYCRRAQTIPFRLNSPEGEGYTVVSSDGGVGVRKDDGRYLLDLKRKEYGSMRALFVIPMGKSNPERQEELLLRHDGNTIGRISVSQIRQLPKDQDGTSVLTLKK